MFKIKYYNKIENSKVSKLYPELIASQACFSSNEFELVVVFATFLKGSYDIYGPESAKKVNLIAP